MEYKSGVKTTEFWLTTVTIIINVLAVTGVIGQGDINYVTELATQVVSGIVAVISLGTYIVSRTNYKKQFLDGGQVEPTADEKLLQLG